MVHFLPKEMSSKIDRHTEILLDHFIERYSLKDEMPSVQFELFATHLAAFRHSGETLDIEECVFGSGGDNGIDAIIILADGNLISDEDDLSDALSNKQGNQVEIIFIQAEKSKSYDQHKFTNFLIGVSEFLNDSLPVSAGTEIKHFLYLWKQLTERSETLLRDEIKCSCYYITGSSDDQPPEFNGRAEKFQKDLQKDSPVTLNICALGGPWIHETEKAIKTQVKKQIKYWEKVALPNDETNPDDFESSLFIISGSELVSMLESPAGNITASLFIDNVRAYLSSSNSVNKELEQTLENERERKWFAVMNNGITVLAANFKANESVRKVSIENFQIINGCQTCHSIFSKRNSLDGVFVLMKVIKTTNTLLSHSIIRGSNRQTPISNFDLIGQSALLEKLEARLNGLSTSGIHILYERRVGQHRNSAHKNAMKLNTRDLAVYFQAFVKRKPEMARRLNEVNVQCANGRIFNQNDDIDVYVATALAAAWAEKVRKSFSQFKVRKSATYLIVAAMSHILFHTEPRCTNLSKKDRQNLEAVVEILSTQHHAKLVADTAVEIVADILQKKSEEEGSEQRDFARSAEAMNKVIAAITVSKAVQHVRTDLSCGIGPPRPLILSRKSRIRGTDSK